jgi:hypothetical protein
MIAVEKRGKTNKVKFEPVSQKRLKNCPDDDLIQSKGAYIRYQPEKQGGGGQRKSRKKTPFEERRRGICQSDDHYVQKWALR